MTPVLVAERTAYWYGEVLGVNDLSATVGRGITGVLGPNGAGKSTFMKLITGQLRPSRGSVEVLGLRPFANRRLYAQLGFCPEHEALYDDMTARDFVSFCMRLHGLSSRESRRAADRALERVGLSAAATRRIGGYSKGMRQRAKLAQAIAHGPRLLVADEPFSGLDPSGRTEIMTLLRELRDSGVDILVSSHVLHEIEALTDKVLLIHRGRILADGTVPEIRRLLDRHPRKIGFKARDTRALGRLLVDLPGVVTIRFEGQEDGAALSVETRDLERLLAELPALIAAARPGITEMTSTDSGLEAVFDYLVG